MANPTTNFGWVMPTPTDLVTDLPADFEVFGQAVDTAFQYLKGGTTGQILSKTSNTDLAYTWVSPNPGDITGVTAGTGLTGGGTSGDVTLTFDQANFGGGQYAAGKNKIINGDFGVWQRGTSFTATGTYNADRWNAGWDSSPTVTISRQTFTPGTAPVAGYEGQFFQRTLVSAASSMTLLDQKQYIEDVRTFAGQTVTVSFWAKADASRAIKIFLGQNFGSGGSSQVDTAQTTINATTSWARYSATITLASVSGKTIGTSSYLALYLRYPGSTFTIDIWGVQVEAGSTATPFQTATGTIQGELAACQRYYVSWNRDAAVSDIGICVGFASSTTAARFYIGLPVVMRTTPTVLDFATLQINNIGSAQNVTALTFTAAVNNRNTVSLNATCSGGLVSAAPQFLNSTTSGYIGIGAEL